MHLDELSAGSVARIAGMTETGRRHLSRYLSLGLIPGSDVTVVRVAPLGCPIQIKVGSTLLSIRKSEAHELLLEAQA
ncbi:MAG: FeoA family protein [Reinekea sp.]|jgi:ferrous iron transport protein A